MTLPQKFPIIYHMERQNYFEGLVAQDDIKDTLTGFIDIYKEINFIPNLFITAPKGCGKTVFARRVGKNLGKKFVELNAGSIKNVKHFMNFVDTHVQNQDITVFLDEAHKLPKDVVNCLLTILQYGEDKTSQFEYEDYTYEFDFTRMSVIAATTEPQNVFHALMDRFEQLELDEYIPNDLSKIVKMICKDITFKPDVLNEIATILRGNARAASYMADKIKNWMMAKSTSKVVGEKEWSDVKSWLKIKPLGLGKKELQLLRIVGERKEVRVTALAATMMLTRAAVMAEEQYLQKQNLIEIKNSVRCLTQKGREYLEELDKVQSIDSIPPVEPTPPAPKPKSKPVRFKLPKPIDIPVEPLIPEDLFQLKENGGR